jgi:GMP synthase (glutamine-hydrolysing)
MSHQKILILDFGSQVTQLIARRLRELHVYSEIFPCTHIPPLDAQTKAVILSGSPYSVNDGLLPNVDLSPYRGKLPLLGVCYGAQLLANQNGGFVVPSKIREYGRANLTRIENSLLLADIQMGSQVWMSHGDTIQDIPENFEIIASTESVKVAAFKIKEEDTYAIQFHPEVTHSTDGQTMLHNFVAKISKLKQDWTPVHFIENTTEELKSKLGNDKVILGLSGGVDSSVSAVLLKAAIGNQLTGIFIDNGLLRKNEFEQVLHAYKNMGLNVVGVDSRARFIEALKGVSDPEQKRKIIGRVFIEVAHAKHVAGLESQIDSLGHAYLCSQATHKIEQPICGTIFCINFKRGHNKFRSQQIPRRTSGNKKWFNGFLAVRKTKLSKNLNLNVVHLSIKWSGVITGILASVLGITQFGLKEKTA